MTKFNKTTAPVLAAAALAGALVMPGSQASADSQPFVGEIMATGINFCPRGWAEANGALLPVASHDALFSLLGTMYGGDGRTTFALPDLRSRTPMGVGTGPGLSLRRIGQKGGQEDVILTENHLASHSHAVNATNEDGTFGGPGNKILAAAHGTEEFGAETIYSTEAATVQMSSEMIANSGGSQPLPTTDPTLVIRYCIALVGIYPSRS